LLNLTYNKLIFVPIDNEAIVLSGATVFSAHSGSGSQFKFIGGFVDLSVSGFHITIPKSLILLISLLLQER
jgi:hypothetical protein